jgi:hypothetical protein
MIASQYKYECWELTALGIQHKYNMYLMSHFTHTILQLHIQDRSSHFISGIYNNQEQFCVSHIQKFTEVNCEEYSQILVHIWDSLNPKILQYKSGR